MTIELTDKEYAKIVWALDQALPEIQELTYQGDIKDTVLEGMEEALVILQEKRS